MHYGNAQEAGLESLIQKQLLMFGYLIVIQNFRSPVGFPISPDTDVISCNEIFKDNIQNKIPLSEVAGKCTFPPCSYVIVFLSDSIKNPNKQTMLIIMHSMGHGGKVHLFAGSKECLWLIDLIQT